MGKSFEEIMKEKGKNIAGERKKLLDEELLRLRAFLRREMPKESLPKHYSLAVSVTVNYIGQMPASERSHELKGLGYKSINELEAAYRKATEFYNLPQPTESRNSGERLGDKIITSILTVGSFIIGLYFLSTNITGNVISSLNQSSANFAGILFLIIGLITSYAWIDYRKKNK